MKHSVVFQVIQVSNEHFLKQGLMQEEGDFSSNIWLNYFNQ